MPRTVAIDFDNTIHPYTAGWQGLVPDMSEPPIPGVVAFLEALKSRGFSLVIYSTRAQQREGAIGIKTWLRRYGLLSLFDDITGLKPTAVAYVDDRAVNCQHHDWNNVLLQVLDLSVRGS